MSNPQKQPLPAKVYVAISTIGIISAISLFILFNNMIQDKHRHDQFYFIILIIVGLGVGAFLFGVMKSYAVYKSKNLPGYLGLGGPVVAAALVVYGGFKLIPDQSHFNVKIQFKIKSGKAEELSGCRLWIENIDVEHKPMDPIDCQVDFLNISSEYEGKKVRFGIKAPGYELVYPDSGYILKSDVFIDLPVQRDQTLSQINGYILDENGDMFEGVLVLLGTTGIADTTTATGLFNLTIPASYQSDSITLYISKKGYLTEIHTVYPSSKQTPTFRLTKSKK